VRAGAQRRACRSTRRAGSRAASAPPCGVRALERERHARSGGRPDDSRNMIAANMLRDSSPTDSPTRAFRGDARAWDGPRGLRKGRFFAFRAE
jgi:hypothetical protein